MLHRRQLDEAVERMLLDLVGNPDRYPAAGSRLRRLAIKACRWRRTRAESLKEAPSSHSLELLARHELTEELCLLQMDAELKPKPKLLPPRPRRIALNDDSSIRKAIDVDRG